MVFFLQLKEQALAKVTGTGAGGLQVLNYLQDGIQFVDIGGDVLEKGKVINHILHLAAEVTVIVYVPNDILTQEIFPLGFSAEGELLYQALVEG